MTQFVVAGTATAADVLAGRKFSAGPLYNANGTMSNRSAENVHMPSTANTVWAGDRVFLQPPKGYYDGESWVTVPAPNLRPEYILSGRGFSDMVGTVPVITSGSDPAQGAGLWPDGGLAVYPSEGYRKGGAGAGEIKVSSAQLQSAEADLRASNIRSGVNVFGVTGTLVERQYSTGLFTMTNGKAIVTGLPFQPESIAYYDWYGRPPIAVGFKGDAIGSGNQDAFSGIYGAEEFVLTPTPNGFNINSVHPYNATFRYEIWN